MSFLILSLHCIVLVAINIHFMYAYDVFVIFGVYRDIIHIVMIYDIKIIGDTHLQYTFIR